MEPYSENMSKIRRDLRDENKCKRSEKFKKLTKFSMIIGNEGYDKKLIGFDSLPAVKDDLRQAKQTSKLLGVPRENTIVLKDTNYEELEKHFDWMKRRMRIISKELTINTGICGGENYVGGFRWDDIKDSIIDLEDPGNKLVIDLRKDE